MPAEYLKKASGWEEVGAPEAVNPPGISQEDLDAAINGLIDSAPGTLNTLNEIAAALNDDANFAVAVQAQIDALEAEMAGMSPSLDMDSVVGGLAAGPVTIEGSHGVSGQTATVVLNHPAGAVAGDTLLAIIDIAAHDAAIPGPPAGWTQLTGSPINLPSTDRSFHVWAKIDSGSEPANYTFTLLGTAYNSGIIAAFRGAGPFSSFIFSSAFSSTAPDISVPPNSMAVVFANNAGGNDNGSVTNYTSQVDTGGGIMRAELFTRSLPAGGATGTATASGATETLHLSVSAPDGTAHQLVVANAGKVVEMGSASTSVVTIPTDANANLPVGSVVVVRRTGAGALTIAASGGVTYNGPTTLVEQHDEVWLHKRAANVWHGSYLSMSEVFPSSVEVLQRIVVGSAQATIDFQNIPQGYENLEVSFMGRGDAAAAAVYMRINADVAANYDYARLQSTNVTNLEQNFGQTEFRVGTVPGSGAAAGLSGISEIDIPAYARSVLHKNYQARSFHKTGVASTNIPLDFWGGSWRSSVAIARLTFHLSAGNFAPGTVVTLRGVRGAPAAVDATDLATQAELDAVVASLAVVGATNATDSYQPVLGDAGKVVELNKATALNFTVPTDATVNFPIGTVIELWQQGVGQVTVVAAGGVTIRSTEGKLKLYGQYAGASLRKRAANEWVLVGDLVT